jgi:hypothetical protein
MPYIAYEDMPPDLSDHLALAVQAARADERLACWKIAEEERKTAAPDKQAWLVAFDIANAIKMRDHGTPSVSSHHQGTPNAKA